MAHTGNSWRFVHRIHYGLWLVAVPLLIVGLAAHADTEVGAIPGSFAVTPSGSATYTIPINVPPGVAGLTPKLALVYNSGLGNSLAGYGWTVSGLSVITVCNDTWAQDGVNQSASFANATPYPDKFCLDGARLVSATGTYGADQSTYRKELDDFSLITANLTGGAGPSTTSGPQWFKVQTSDGLTYEYGKTADSEIVASGPSIASGVTMVRAWALDQIYDKYGNSISFTYQQDTTNGDFWPTQITYTNHASTAGPHTIVFKYTSLSSISPGLVWTSYQGGALISQTQRLNEIDVDYSGSPTFTYTLAYDNTLTDANGNTGTERSQLTSVNECAGSTCYPATTINWQSGTSGWGGANAAPMGGNTITATQAGEMQLIDINGNGRADIIYPTGNYWMVMLSNGDGFNAPQSANISTNNDAADALPIDVDGDGHEGLLVPQNNSSNTLDWYLLKISVSSSGVVSATYTDTGRAAVGIGGNATVADINGDGLPDILYSDGTNLYWYENLGGGNFAAAAVLEAGAFSSGTNGLFQFQHQFAGATPDFDGTGRGGFATLTEIYSGIGCTPDYCPPPQAPKPLWSIQEGGGYSNGATVAPTSIGGFKGDSGDLVAPMFVDFNGDGLSDVLYAPHTAPQDTNPDDWYVYESTGTAAAAKLTGGLTGGDTGVAFDSNAMQDSLPVDYAGNGRQDVLVPMFNSSGSCTSLGLIGYAGGVFHGTASIGLAGEGPCASGYDYNSIRVGDITGNGFEDLVWVANGTVYYALHQGVHPDLVTSINNGFNQNYSNITYAALSDTTSSIYTPGNATIPTQSYPAENGDTVTAPEGRNYTGAVYVVSAYDSNDGVGGTVTHSFSYSGALLDTLGRGFLGFASTSGTDQRTAEGNSITTLVATNLLQWFPFTGDATSSAVSVNGNEEKSVSTGSNGWSAVTTVGTAQFVYNNSSTTSLYELGSTTPYASTTTTDTPTISSGELQSQVVTTTTSPATDTSTVTTNYDVDTSNWCLSLPSSVTVTANNTTYGSMSRSVSYTDDTQDCRVTLESAFVTDGGTTQTLSTGYKYDPTYGFLTERDVNTSSGTCSTSGACDTQYAYDSTNTFVAQVTNALGEKSKATWDPSLGVQLSATDPNSATTTYSHDSFGLLNGEALGDGTSVQWSYCLPVNGCSVPSGVAYSVTETHYSTDNTSGATLVTDYDSFGRPILKSTYVVGGLSNVATTYDALGRVVQMTTPYVGSATTSTYTTYDYFSRPTAVYVPAGQTIGCSTSYEGETACETSYGYDGLSTNVTDPNGKITTKTEDPLGEVTQMKDAAGGITYYAYDAFGDLRQTTDPATNVTTMQYDDWGRKLMMTDLDMGQWTYAYDPRGLMTLQTDPKNQQISMTYDALGRMTSRTEPLPSGGTGTDTWTYDGPNGVPTPPDIGSLYSVQGADGYFKQYQYDSIGRPNEEDVTIAGTTYATTTSYNTFGHIASVTYPAAPSPDADDPPVAVVSPSQSAVVGQTVTLDGSGSYDPDNGPQPLTYSWQQTSGPVNTSANGATTPKASFSSSVAGTYDFTLTVSDGELTDSASTSVTLNPAQVTGVSASSVNPNTGNFTLNWTAPEGAVDYNVEQSTNGGPYGLLPSPYSGTSAPLSGYGNGTYSFAVQACGTNDTPCGAFSSPPVSVTVLRTPSVPGAPGVTPTTTTTGTFNISWSKPSGTVTYYELYTSVNGGAYSSQNVGNVLSKSVTETVNGTYDFEIAACNSAACSAPSSPTAGTVNLPVPAAPTLCCSVNINQGQSVTLTWSPNGTVSATYYGLESAPTSSFTGISPANMGLSTSITVTPSYTRYFRVEACNTAGCGPWSGTAEVHVNLVGCKTCAPTPAPGASSTSNPGTGFAVRARPDHSGLRLFTGHLAPPLAPLATQHLVANLQPIMEMKIHRAHGVMAKLRNQALNIELAQLRNQPELHLYAELIEQPGTQFGHSSFKFESVESAIDQGTLSPQALMPNFETTASTSRYVVNYVYDTHENLTEVVDAANPSLIYWQATSGNAFGEVTADILGNGVIDTYGFDAATGALDTAQSGKGMGTNVMNMAYTWDGDGNLKTREDQNAGLTETLHYDSLNRLREADVTGSSTSSESFNYDAVGNLTSRTASNNPAANIGTYTPNSSHPMEISYITSPSGGTRNFSYDPDGNITNDGVHSNTWDALNRPILITNSGTSSSIAIAYTPGGARYQETTTSGVTSSTLTEVNALFEVQATSSYVYYRERIMGGSGIVAVRTIRNDGILTTRYITSDHLGSVSVITDEAGNIDEQMSYDAFGMRRNPTTWQDYSSLPDLTDITDKGYTGQQQMDAVGLVHMNGRVYDPVVGRFMSADPTVPDPLDGQSFNRYAYVENNPLSAIDPSGFGCPQGGYCITIPGLSGTYNLIGVSSWQYQLPGPPPDLGPIDPINDNLAQWQAPNIDTPATILSPTIVPPDTTPSTSAQPSIQKGSGNSGSTGSGNNNNLGGGNFLLPIDTPCQYGSNCGGNNGVQQAMNDTNGVQDVSFGDIDWGSMGSGKLRGPSIVEIPSPGAPTGGGPSIGAPKVPGSVGVPIPGPYNPRNPDYHHYQFENLICFTIISSCTPQNVFQGLVRYPFPGASGVPVGNRTIHDISFLGINGGPVETRIYPDSLTVVNVTEPGHIFYNGSVTQIVVPSGDAIFIRTTGVGVDQNQFLKWLNVETARPGFTQADAEITWWVLTHH